MQHLYLNQILFCFFIVSTIAGFNRDKLYLEVYDSTSLEGAFSILDACFMSSSVSQCNDNNITNICDSSVLQICCISTCYDSIEMIFVSGRTYILTENYTVSNLQNIRFTVNQSGIPSTINCATDNDSTSANPGFAFVNITNLTVEYLNIVGCGMKHVSTSVSKGGEFVTFLSALYVQNSTNLSVRNISVLNNNGTGLVIVDTIGTISIEGSVFRDNRVSKSNAVLSGGGGVIIEFTECTPGILGCNSSNYQLANNSIVTVDNCVFEYNSALYNVSKNVGANLDDRTFFGFGYGGGLFLQFNGHATEVFIQVIITSSNFSHNVANNGGGLAILGNYNTTHINVSISGCTFLNNSATFFGGGGILVGFVIFNSEEGILHNTIVMNNCIFESNKADTVGGGLSWHGGTELLGTLQTNYFAVKSSLFVNNQAQYGFAIQINKEYFDIIDNGTFLNLVIDSCNFTSNSANTLFMSAPSGAGAVSASQVNLQFSGCSYFTANNSTALVGDGAELVFHNNSFTVFQNNSGFLGGAILLMSSSKIVAHFNSTLMFVRNTAVVKGGAIYVQFATLFDYLIVFSCFIRYPMAIPNDEQGAHFIFIDNTAADNQSNSLFATTLSPCKNIYPDDFLDKSPFCFSSNLNQSDNSLLYERKHCLNDTQDQLSTAAIKFCNVPTGILYLIPGKVHDLKACIADELGNQVTDAQFVATCVDTCTRAGPNCASTQSFSSKPHVLPVYHTTNGSIQLAGLPGSECQLQLQTIADFQISGIWSVELLNCPPGFVLSNDVCICLTDQTRHNPVILGCEQTRFQAYFNSLYWIGYRSNNTNDLLFGPCPYRYCYKGSNIFDANLLPSVANATELDRFVCGNSSRTGRLCGRCIDGYSVALNSPTFTCEKCDDEYKLGFLYLTLSYIIPVSVLLYVIMTYDIEITTGLFGPFVFFSQLISSEYHYILIYTINSNHPVALEIFNIIFGIYSISNLDFFNYDILKYCMFRGAGTIDIVAFELLLSLYPILLIAAYALFQRYSYIFQRLWCFKKFTFTNKSITHGICAFLVLCFASVNLKAFTILIPAKINFLQTDDSYDKLVYLQGDLEYFNGRHILYTVGSILFIIMVIAIPTLILLVHPLLMQFIIYFKWGETKPVLLLNKCLMIHKLKPVIDSFQGKYEDHLQFFAGLQIFFYRTVFFILVVATTPDVNDSLLFLTGYFIVIILVQSLAMPFKNRWDNALYTIIYSLMLAILMIEQYMINSQTDVHALVVGFHIVLCLLPLCWIVLYLVWKLSKSVRKYLGKLKIQQEKSPQVGYVVNQKNFAFNIFVVA